MPPGGSNPPCACVDGSSVLPLARSADDGLLHQFDSDLGGFDPEGHGAHSPDVARFSCNLAGEAHVDERLPSKQSAAGSRPVARSMAKRL